MVTSSVSRNKDSGLEVDAHDDAARRRPGDLGEAGGGERTVRADVQFVQDDVDPVVWKAWSTRAGNEVFPENQ